MTARPTPAPPAVGVSYAGLPAEGTRVAILTLAGRDEGTFLGVLVKDIGPTTLTVAVLELDDGRRVRFPWHAITAIVDPPTPTPAPQEPAP